MSYFGYILRSSVNGQYYVGQTSDIIRRVALHNAGRVDSTKRYLPWELVYSVKFDSRSEAIAWEQKTKGRKSREFLELLIASRNGDRPYERKGVAGPVPFRSCGTGRGSPAVWDSAIGGILEGGTRPDLEVNFGSASLTSVGTGFESRRSD